MAGNTKKIKDILKDRKAVGKGAAFGMIASLIALEIRLIKEIRKDK